MTLPVTEFSPAVIEKLGYYVYLLIDPETKKVFYVGKGTGNRIFAHLNRAIKSPLITDKLEKIREIQSKSLQVVHLIHRHGLTEKEAFEVEASLIDFIGLDDLTNVVEGQNSNYRGQMNINDVIALYDAPRVIIKEPAILVIVNRAFRRGMNEEEVYEITRGDWVLGTRREKAEYGFTVFNGIVRQVYKILSWSPVEAKWKGQNTKKRWRFNGKVANDLQHYVGGNVSEYIKLGAQNPVKYINC